MLSKEDIHKVQGLLTDILQTRTVLSTPNVNTARIKHTTARDRAIVSENKGKGANVVKASACWVWKAKNSSASNTFKKYSYIDARGQIQDPNIWVDQAHDLETILSLMNMKIMMVDLFSLVMVKEEFLEKGIKREFSVARTPQQNGVAERKNRTLIEAARTMLVDSKFPTTFWAEAVNTACYVLNRVLVIKPHNKTPYELIRGRPPLIDFMKPFGCPVTILNTRDHLGKFDGKANEGYFVGFLENTTNVKGNGLDWLFDVDSLTISMNYVPVAVGNKTNGIAGTKDNIGAGPKDFEGDARMKPTEVDENEASDKSGKHDQEARSEYERLNKKEMHTEHTNSSNGINTVSTHVSTAGPSFDTVVPITPVNTVEPFVSTANESEE
ncbi:ribonuclease H-like domain-containing protein [Tanacetum coccineum]